ncbi:MAG: CoA-binding protein [Halieaceae bacterium]|jgi:predicted CoA-binding protein|nr:CoA-binding protein [Halieaceae bacterium]
MPLSSDQAIATVLREVKTIAVLGASHKPERPSHEVMEFLLRQGYQVFPVNPGLAGTQLLGQTVVASLAELQGPVDMVDVFRHPEYLPGIVEEVISAGIATLWTQLGVIDLEAAARAEGHGIRVVMDRCPAIEAPRLERLGLL